MATTTSTSASTRFNKEPLFFCAPGPKDGLSNQVKASFPTQSGGDGSSKSPICRTCGTGFPTRNKLFRHLRDDPSHEKDDARKPASLASPVPWPSGTRLRIKMMPGHKTFTIVEGIITKAFSDWQAATNNGGWELEWVQSGDADIRISFRNDVPNWSAWGTRAMAYSQNEATMNFCLGGWKDDRTVFSQHHIRRTALHLFGHALGLPHASTKWSSPWNGAELEKQCGSFFSTLAQADNGSPELGDANSIMHFDRPASLGSPGSSDERHGRKDASIDSEAIRLVQKLYPPGPFSRRITASEINGWRGFIGSPNNQVPPAVQLYGTTATTNGVTGLSKIDMGLNGNFRLDSHFQNVQQKVGFEVVVKTWWDTHLVDAACDVLTFDQDDQRVQVGRVNYGDIWPGGGNDRSPGVTLSRDVRFDRPFKNTPKVVAFISCVDSVKGKYMRLDVNPSNIDRYGFRLNIRTWADTTLYTAGASWLAHEADDPTIRSGLFDNPFRPNWATVEDSWQDFSSPFPRKPRHMFAAFSYIDTHPFSNIRLRFDVPDWNERSVHGRLSTWVEESRFNQLKGSYVAIL